MLVRRESASEAAAAAAADAERVGLLLGDAMLAANTEAYAIAVSQQRSQHTGRIKNATAHSCSLHSDLKTNPEWVSAQTEPGSQNSDRRGR
jgi:hypothetical protein